MSISLSLKSESGYDRLRSKINLKLQEIRVMKIAAYNIWNSKCGMSCRMKYIANEIQKIKADAVCLQEDSNRELAESLAVSVGISR